MLLHRVGGGALLFAMMTATSLSGCALRNAIEATLSPSSFRVSPTTLAADGNAAATLRVQVRDSSGTPLAGARVELASDGNATIVQPQTTDGDGMAEGEIRSTALGTQTVSARLVQGSTRVRLPQTVRVTFIAGEPAAATSSLAASPTRVEADGISVTTLVLTMRDARGNAVPSLAIRATSSDIQDSFTQEQGNTDASGVFITRMASRTAGEKTITLTGASLALQASVTFYAGAPDTRASRFVATPRTAGADGLAG